MKYPKEIQEKYDAFWKQFEPKVRHKGTALANFDCELCGCSTTFDAFTFFMYPDFSMKALCNGCGKKEYIRLDYGNKN